MRRLRIPVAALVAIALGATLYMHNGSNMKNFLVNAAKGGKTAVESKFTPVEKEEKKETIIKINAIGDVALGRDHRLKGSQMIDDVYKQKNGDNSYFFANVADILSKDDLTIANLESALTTENERPEKYDYGNNYWFKGDPAYVNILKPGSVELVSLANNHTYDYKQKGFDDTRNTLKAAGVSYYGYDDLYETEIKGIKIGVAGFNQLGPYEEGTDINKFKEDVKTKIAQLKSRNNLVIVSFHWGKEYKNQYNETQTDIGHFAIDNGADLVLGHHPHVIQGVEQYNGKYIAYSLGNFCFGGNKRPPDFDTLIFQQSFTFDKDNKLVKVSEPDYVPCLISSVRDINNFQPTPAKGADIPRILNKINQYSAYKMSAEKIAEKSKPDMVNLAEFIPGITINLRYASTANITGEPVYKDNTARLRKETAIKLKRANEELNKQGYNIMIWDAYRPAEAQQLLYDKATNKAVFADPKKGSNHTRGCAVDITLTDMNGNQLDMPTDFDDPTSRAGRTFKGATQTQIKNAKILTSAMVKAGFNMIPNEWWHYDDSDAKEYDFVKLQ